MYSVQRGGFLPNNYYEEIPYRRTEICQCDYCKWQHRDTYFNNILILESVKSFPGRSWSLKCKPKSLIQKEWTLQRLLPGRCGSLPSSSLCLVNHQCCVTKLDKRSEDLATLAAGSRRLVSALSVWSSLCQLNVCTSSTIFNILVSSFMRRKIMSCFGAESQSICCCPRTAVAHIVAQVTSRLLWKLQDRTSRHCCIVSTWQQNAAAPPVESFGPTHSRIRPTSHTTIISALLK